MGIFFVLERPSPPSSRGRRIAWLAGCAAASLCTPFGLRTYQMIVADLTLSPVHVAGWARTPFAHLEAFWAILALFWMIAAVQLRRAEAVSRGLLGIGIFLSCAAARYAANTPYLIVFAVPYACRALSAWTPEKRRSGGALALSGSLAAALFLAGLAHARAGIQPGLFPVEACDFIERYKVPGPFYEEYKNGGYWMWRFGTRRPDFIDGRYPAVEGYRTLLPAIESAMAAAPADWNGFLERYGVQAALMSYPRARFRPPVFQRYFPQKLWSLIDWDDTAMIFVRRRPAERALIERFGFQTIEPDMDPEDFRRQAMSAAPERRRRMREELERNRRLHPDSLRTRAFLEALRT